MLCRVKLSHVARLNTQLCTWAAAYRKNAELTQQELARLAGVSRQTVVELEKGDYNPSVVLAMRLAVLLDAAVEELFALPGAEIEALHACRDAGRQQKGGPGDGDSRGLARLEGDRRHRAG